MVGSCYKCTMTTGHVLISQSVVACCSWHTQYRLKCSINHKIFSSLANIDPQSFLDQSAIYPNGDTKWLSKSKHSKCTSQHLIFRSTETKLRTQTYRPTQTYRLTQHIFTLVSDALYSSQPITFHCPPAHSLNYKFGYKAKEKNTISSIPKNGTLTNRNQMQDKTVSRNIERMHKK